MTPRRQIYGTARSQTTRKHRPDYLLLITASILLALGIIVMVAISPALTEQGRLPGSYYVFRQLTALALGVLLFKISSKLTETFFRRSQRLMVAASLISVAAVLAISGMAFRWVQIGGFSFQPAELIKFTVVVSGAIFLVDRIKSNEINDPKKTLYPIGLGLLGLGFIVVYLQKDLGSMVVILSIIFAMMLMANVPLDKLVLGGVIITFAIVLAIVSTPYRRDRFMTFMQPERDCTTTGYHACQALIAVRWAV